MTTEPSITPPLESVTVPSIVQVMICARALEGKRWNMKRVRERAISEEQYLLSLACPPLLIRLQVGVRTVLFITSASSKESYSKPQCLRGVAENPMRVLRSHSADRCELPRVVQ